MSGKHFGAERISDFLSYSSKAATDVRERAQVNLTDGCSGRASTSTFSRKSSFRGLFLRSQVLDDIPNLLILCLHLGNRVSPPAWRGEGLREKTPLSVCDSCLPLPRPLRACNYLTQDVSNNIYCTAASPGHQLSA